MVKTTKKFFSKQLSHKTSVDHTVFQVCCHTIWQETFEGETFANFRVSRSQNLGAWHLLVASASNLKIFYAKISFSTHSRKFSLTKVSCYMVAFWLWGSCTHQLSILSQSITLPCSCYSPASKHLSLMQAK